MKYMLIEVEDNRSYDGSSSNEIVATVKLSYYPKSKINDFSFHATYDKAKKIIAAMKPLYPNTYTIRLYDLKDEPEKEQLKAE